MMEIAELEVEDTILIDCGFDDYRVVCSEPREDMKKKDLIYDIIFGIGFIWP